MLFSLATTAVLMQAKTVDEATEEALEDANDEVEVAVVVAILFINLLPISLFSFSDLVSAETPETTKLKAKIDNNDSAKIFLFI